MESAEVHNMARAFLLAADPSSQAQFAPELIKDICETSCGHPGFIKTILGDLTAENEQAQDHIQLPRRLTDEEKGNYIRKFNADIDHYIPWGDDPQIKEMYEKCLCVLRFINREILDALGVEGKNTWTQLIELQLLSGNESSTNSVIRQMRALKLHHEHKDTYYAAHRQMLKIYLAGAHQLADEIQCKYMREVLFHLAHMLLTKASNQNERYRRMSKIVLRLTFQILRDLPIGIKDHFIDQMNRDIELSNLLEECIGDNNLQQLQDLFREKEIPNV
jgi:hypothetical protein